MEQAISAAHERYLYKPFIGSSHSWALNILKDQPVLSSVLDVGAGSGAIGQELRNWGFKQVDAVEVDPETRKFISNIYRSVVESLEAAPQSGYDIILFLDLLEHLQNPDELLRKAAEILNPGGHILISLPNVAHWSVRIPLLFGNFNYKERGIMDRTHLTFFTRKTATEMIKRVPGITIREIKATIEPVELLLPAWAYDNPLFSLLSKARLFIANTLPGLFAYQNLFHLQKL